MAKDEVKDEALMSPVELKEKKRQEKMEAHADCSWCRLMGMFVYSTSGSFANIYPASNFCE